MEDIISLQVSDLRKVRDRRTYTFTLTLRWGPDESVRIPYFVLAPCPGWGYLVHSPSRSVRGKTVEYISTPAALKKRIRDAAVAELHKLPDGDR